MNPKVTLAVRKRSRPSKSTKSVIGGKLPVHYGWNNRKNLIPWSIGTVTVTV
jgi:hypothetical protein